MKFFFGSYHTLVVIFISDKCVETAVVTVKKLLWFNFESQVMYSPMNDFFASATKKKSDIMKAFSLHGNITFFVKIDSTLTC